MTVLLQSTILGFFGQFILKTYLGFPPFFPTMTKKNIPQPFKNKKFMKYEVFFSAV